MSSSFFFFNAPSTTAISTLSLHDALPIYKFLLGASLMFSSSARGCPLRTSESREGQRATAAACRCQAAGASLPLDRKSTRLNSSHQTISYAVFCLKKKNKHQA